MVCKKCNKSISNELYFCTNCGELLKDIGIKTENSKVAFAERSKAFIDYVNSYHESTSNNNHAVWDVAIDKYVKLIEKTQHIMKYDLLKEQITNRAGLFKSMNLFLSKCKTPEFHIAFVGAIKAGKSTLINALLGKNLASTSVTPETAVLTKFRAAKNKNYVKVVFYNSTEWSELWQSILDSKSKIFMDEYKKHNAEEQKSNWIGSKDCYKEFDSIIELENEIEKWTSSKKATHYFVKEVEVGLMDFNLPEEVVFVDTPGLDDAVRYRSDVTRRYIDRANAVFACVKSDAMTGPELATIYRIFANTRYNPEKVYVIGTQLDTLNRPSDNWVEQKNEWIKYLSQDDCFRSKQLAEKNVFAVAAHVENLVLNFNNLDEDSIIELESMALKFRIRNIEENIEELHRFSNVSFLKGVLQSEIVCKYKELLHEDLKNSYLELKELISTVMIEFRSENEKLLEIANSDMEKIQQERMKANEELENIQKYKSDLLSTLELVKKGTQQRVDELCNQLKGLGSR